MSHTFSDCFSDLLCCEEAGILAGDKPPEYLREIEFLVDEVDFMAELVAEEREYSLGFDYPARFRSGFLDAAVREEAIAWILKVHSYHHFQPLTAYLSVNYMDRFLASHRLPQASGWPLQLLSVASLSLAAKMEETLVPSLLDLQVEGTSFIFEPGTICRMELLVLNALNWRLRSITPFNFIDFFAYKVDPTGAFIRYLVSFAVQIILATIQEVEFTDYWPSSVAAAAILCAADTFPNLSLSNPGNAVSWCAGLSQEKILSCYRLMQVLVVGNSRQRSARNLLPQLKARTWTEMVSGDSMSSFSRKRRKLNNCLWADDDYTKQ